VPEVAVPVLDEAPEEGEVKSLLLLAALLAQEAKPIADLAAAKAAAKERKVRILAVVTEEFYPSEPCKRMEKALDDKEAAAPFVPLKVVEKEDVAFSKGLALEDLGHPYTAILDAEGRVLASLRGAFESAAWAKEVKRLAAAADGVEAKEAALAKSPADAKSIWEFSEALRSAGRVREADDALARAENADPEGKSGLAALFRFRRVEARVEDRMSVQDFEGARALLDGYDKDHPNSPRKAWVAFYRALCRGLVGEVDGAIEDLKEVAAGAKEKDPELLALAESRVAVLEKVVEKKK
jgi:tetratricopeptide (TPR) repeat protein